MAPSKLPPETKYQSLQEDEIQALQAIYYDGFEEIDCEIGPWKTTTERAFNLLLRSRADSDTMVKLIVKLTATYPNTVPILSVEQIDSLQPKFQAELQDILTKKPKALLGSEMIHEIAQAIEDVLDNAVQHTEQTEQAPTLEEERAQKESLAKEAALEKARKQEAERLAAKEAEKRLVSEKMVEELEHRQHRKRKSAHFQDSHPAIFKEASDNHLLNPQPRMSRENTREDQEIVSFPPIDFDLPWVIFQGQAGRKQYVFKSVINPHDDNSAWVSLLSGEGPITDVWTTFPFGIKHDDAKIVMKEASLRSFDNTKTAQNEDFRERINSLGSLLKDVSDLTNKNSTFLPILKTGIFYDKNFEHSRIIRIIYPFVPHGSLHDQFLVEGFTIDEVRERIKELLAALELLHSRGILHRRLHLRNIFIVQGRKGGRNLRLADCGFQNEFDKAMHPDDCEARQKRQDEAKATDLVIGIDPSSGTAPSRKTIQKLILKARASYDGEFEVNGTSVDELLRCPPPGWTAPEIAESPEAGGNSKTDIWDLGIVILQMLFGPEIMGFDSPDVALKRFVPSTTLSNFLRKMLHNEPSKRVTPFHLSNDPFLSEPNDRRYGTAPGGEFDFSPLVFPAVARPPKEDHSTNNSISRYNTDFDEIIRVGKGGFGSVFQARNKIDGQFYAIKKVRRSPATLYKALSEIVLLSRLNHPNVVRYFGAWIESAEDKSNDNEESDSEYDSETDSDPDSFPPTTGALLSRPSVISHLTGDMDHVSSKGGYIEFGYDEEEPPEFDDKVNNNGFAPDSDDDQDQGASSKDPLSRRKSSDSPGPRPLKQVLYIQMEFCEKKTLRDLIMADLSDKHNQIWSLLRSILEGLCHIHGNGIIHRDLKPENIFIEGSGIPRIGDFGLATSGLFTVRKTNPQPSMHSPDLTRSVGTAKYVAPELRSAVSESYTDKVDMYSLGIILFEMCAHFETEYGRTLQITSLRQRDHTLPPLFDRGEPAKFGEIIMELVDHDPSKRPTSEDLLKSGEVPLKIEDEMIKRMFHTFKDPDNSEFPKIMEALFSQPIAPVKDYVWDVESQPVPANELILLDLVRQELSTVLRLHGAIETSRPLLIPRSKYYSNTAAQLLHPDGTLVQLPYDLTLPNARAIAKNPPSAWKTYTFGSVYRDHHNGGAAEPSLELDFDVMAPTSKDATIEEAEVIKVIDEILDKLHSLNDAPLCFHINRAGLLELIMDFAAVPASQRTLVKEFICRINFTNLTWSKARKLLGAPTVGLSVATLDQLGRFNFCDEPKKSIRKLKGIFESQDLPDSFMDELHSIFEHLESLLEFAKRFNVKRRLILAPFSGVNEKFYSGGLMFQCIFEGRKAEIVAAGGRYDSLIKDLVPNTNTQYPECHAVGFILGWERVWKTMVRLRKDGEKKAFAKKALAETGLWGTRRCDVLVASMDSSLLRSTCIDIVSDLWAADISAELAKDASSPEEIMARSRPDNHIWIVIVRQNAQSFQDMVLKVKDMTKKFDHEVKAPDLVRWLKAELRERRVKERKRLAATEPSKMENSEARGKGPGKK